MTDFENELRLMLVPNEITLLDLVLSQTSARDGAIANLISYALRQQQEAGLFDILYPEPKNKG